ncbi:succinylglutamate desuccinylase/aspartoacylase domain-containing protein [Azospirillum halopraeferens]|uniref:succinylglutamate desuccinylase/aspartoacylase domain-containing protein n=1 Tax=Azospirillum halopraeferens TaxID=34010 RepID=UPI000406C4E3|nr:succinylglutamate desuccinylase/aspartoacylase family protein [Azospirillum halopraeferens]
MHTGLYHALDFTKDGKSLDFLAIPFSIDRSPYYQVKVPVCRIRNGDGPRVLLMAGNHGDEYEGELLLGRLFRRLDPARIRGELTILPVANAPAVMAARRRSPLDDGNLNRAFPGDAGGTPTARLAHFLEHELFARHDVVFDIHSGGTSMAHLPCALIERQGPPDRLARALELMRALGMPYGFVAENGALAPTSMAAAARAGAIGLSGEFGGGGTVTPDTMRLTARAIDNLLMAVGVTQEPILEAPAAAPAPMQLLQLDSHRQGIYALRRGWFEPVVDVGARVAAGDLAGWLHDLTRLDVPEEALRFRESGIVISRRLHTDSEAGDCLIQVARPVEEADILARAA